MYLSTVLFNGLVFAVRSLHREKGWDVEGAREGTGMQKAHEKVRGCRRHARRWDAEGTREGAGCGRHARRGGMRKAREKGRDAEGT
jgi:hypothetical protein